MDRSALPVHWSSKLSVGIPEVDREHQRFLSLVNDLVAFVAERKAKAEIERQMRLVLADAISHFENEERLFLEFGYPEATRHALLHKQIRNRLIRMVDEIKATDLNSTWVDKALHLRQLLVDHLLQEDIKYRGYL